MMRLLKNLSSTRKLSHLAVVVLLSLGLTACGVIALPFGPRQSSADIAAGVSDGSGLARVETSAGVIDFQVTSGLTGERLEGIRVRVAVVGKTRLLHAKDPTRHHLPAAGPVLGEAPVRQLVIPHLPLTYYHLTSAL